MKVTLQILSKIGCHGNVSKGIKKRFGSTKFIQYLSFGEKIVKIGPVNPEIICVKLKKKKKLTHAKYIALSQCSICRGKGG